VLNRIHQQRRMIFSSDKKYLLKIFDKLNKKNLQAAPKKVMTLKEGIYMKR
jgi:hypothetical protein